MTDTKKNLALQGVMLVAGAALILLILALLIGFHERSTITDRICQAQIQDRRALRESFIVARDFSLTSPVRSDSERTRIANFYTQILNHTPPLRCVDGKPQPVKDKQ